MGRKDFNNTVAEVLPNIIKNEASKAIGALHFFKKDKKTRGKLYFRGGFIYAIELTTYTPNVVNRIVTNEHIRDGYREKILDRFGTSLTSWAVVPFVLQGQLFPERPLLGYIKDYFLDAFDELYSWTDVQAEFKVNEEPPSSVPHVPSADPAEIIEKAVLRKRMIETEIAQPWNSPVSQIDNLRFRRNVTQVPDNDYNSSLLLTIAEGKLTIGEATEYLGWSRYNMKRDLFDLWQKGYIDILHPKGLTITNRTPDELARKTTPVVRQIPVSHAPEPTPIVNEIPEPVVTPIIEETVTVPAVTTPVEPFVAPIATPVAPITSSPLGTMGAVPAGGATSRLAALAAQMKAELVAQEQEKESATAHRDALIQRQETIETEIKLLEDKLIIAKQRREDVLSDLSEANVNLANIEAEYAATMDFLK